MLHQEQHHRQVMRMDQKKRVERTRSAKEEEEVILEIVDMSGMALKSMPDPSINTRFICKLDLSNNDLQSIPESLTARLLNVMVLDVHSNQLKSLPNSIGCLSKLKTLNVSGNMLQSLPRTIENCRSLEELNANFNKLTQLPDTIGFELINLKKLLVNCNKLVFLPMSTSHLTSLQILDARLNCLRSLPEDLENLINLEVLNVSQNFHFLATLPYSIGLLLSLVELDVSYNNITTLPESIGCLKKLQKLRAEGNPLVSPPMDVMEQGLHVVKGYLCEKINGMHNNSPKKTSWFGKLARCSTFNGANMPREDGDNYIMHNERSIDSLSSPKYLGMFSPRRLLSPRSYFSR
ncbi:plant intracellular Ras-group-related LRR protein 6-like [Coffea arabica]|uniref:Plant intracellular Ras-group-related LRR protein 6-like n=1 Tax=Coffea arabica TaxID=13443 RepID=A0A6P6SIP7_COFAR|nr:plant intracellular Ras-group-related LRR protein 6-like [Coffea arabica]